MNIRLRYTALLAPVVLMPLMLSCGSSSGKGQTLPSAGARGVASSARPDGKENRGRVISLEDATSARATGVPVRSMKWSPDGTLLGFLAPESSSPSSPMALWVYDVGERQRRILVKASELVGSIKESDAEKARRERMRMSRSGIVEYVWAPDGRSILFPLSGALYIYDLASKKARMVPGTSDTAPEITPTLSGKGFLAYCHGDDIVVRRVGSGQSITIGMKGLRLGVAEFVAQEEMGRYRGLWWSRDGGRLLFTSVDESKVPVRERLEYGPSGARVVRQRYPSVGKPNAIVKLHAMTVTETSRPEGVTISKPIEMQLGRYEYVARAGWLPDGRVWAALQDRLQKELRLVACDACTGKCNEIMRLSSQTWVELHDDWSFGPDGFIWAVETRAGRSLQFFDYSGHIRAAMPASSPVASLLHVDWKKGEAWMETYADGGVRTALTVWDFRRNVLRQVKLPSGWHSISIAPSGRMMVDAYTTLSRPLRMIVRKDDGSEVSEIPPLVAPAPWLSRLRPPQLVQIPYDGGTLNGLWFNAHVDTRRTIVFVYGGPHGHMVRDAMRGSMLWHHWFASRGFNVLVVDGRGGLYRDEAFAKAPYHAFGRYEVEDSKAIADYLQSRGIPRRCRAIWGWSYGGYTVLATMTDSDLFVSGAAVAPPTDWRLYDTHYTERYMGLDEKLYESSSITRSRLARMKGALLLVHGMSDDNVLLVNTLRVMYELQSIPHRFRLMLYPGKAHSLWGNATRRHLLGTLMNFFMDTVKCR